MSEHHDSQKKTDSFGGKLSAFFHKIRTAVARHPVSPLLYVTILAVAIGAVAFDGMYTRAYVVNVDGQELGVLATAEEMDDIVAHVESRVSSILGEDYAYEADITVTPAYTPANSFSDPAVMEDTLFANAGALVEACVIVVDGVELGYGPSEEALQAMLDAIARPYLTQDTTGYTFLENVELRPVEVPANTEYDLDAITAILTAYTVEEAFYTVQKGDTFNAIAYSLEMTPAQLKELNPGVDVNKLYVGQKLTIQQAIPFLSVVNYTNETYEAPVPSPIEYIETADLYVGSTSVKEQGTDGRAMVNANVTYVNGIEAAREVLTSETLEEPTITYMYTGTTPRPKTASNGYYIKPVSGRITSGYGYRYIFGAYSWHSGIDIGASYGTVVRAADGGKVTYAGWRGSYGKLIIITHDDGSQTYYAHNSTFLVSKGDRVYQGQPICKIGLTGTTTGPHLHFEIRINGKTVNPANYIR